MKRKIIGLMGQAGAGKDTFADYMGTKHNAAKVALADPLKRFCREVYNFSYEQLWGPSQFRNAPDPRYFRGSHWVCQKCISSFYPNGVEEKTIGLITAEVNCFYCGEKQTRDTGPSLINCFLTPRYALQLLGTEWGRNCYNNTWVDYALRVATRITDHDPKGETQPFYINFHGLEFQSPGELDLRYSCVIIPDCRFQNEVDAIHEAGGVVVQLVREGKDGNIQGGIKGHASEQEQKSIKNVNLIIHVQEGVKNYYTQIEEFSDKVLGLK